MQVIQDQQGPFVAETVNDVPDGTGKISGIDFFHNTQFDAAKIAKIFILSNSKRYNYIPLIIFLKNYHSINSSYIIFLPISNEKTIYLQKSIYLTNIQ